MNKLNSIAPLGRMCVRSNVGIFHTDITEEVDVEWVVDEGRKEKKVNQLKETYLKDEYLQFFLFFP